MRVMQGYVKVDEIFGAGKKNCRLKAIFVDCLANKNKQAVKVAL